MTHHPKIMIVEDETLLAADLAESLRSLGYTVTSRIGSGEEALESIDAASPDLVLMDIQLAGELDGIETAGKIRRLRNTPVVFMSAFSDESFLSRAKDIQPYGYLVKPVAPRELHTTISMALHKAKMEKALRKSEHHFRTVAESTYDWETWRGPDGRYLYLSPSCERITGYSPNDFYDNPFFIEEIVHPEDHETVSRHIREGEKPGPVGHVRFRIRHRDGTLRWISHYCHAVYDAQGEYLGRRSSNRDTTMERRLEQELLRGAKLESVSTLVGGIAHDYNNLITIIMGNIDLARMLADPNDAAQAALSEAEEAALRARELTRQLVTFSNNIPSIKKTGSILPVIQEATDLLVSGDANEFRLNMADSLWPVEIDSNQIEKALKNVIINARESMTEGGVITIRAENLDLVSREGVQDLPLSEGKYVKISVRDQGKGIPEEHLPRIFDPYFSTKERGTQKGMGLGLAVTFAILKRHGGLITVSSTPGAGTTFYLYIPAVTPKPAAGTAAATDQLREFESHWRSSEKGKGKILIMDDEEMIRTLLIKMVERFGYQGESVRDGDSALERFTAAKQAGAPFDLVILNLIIPGGIGGRDTISLLKSVDPGVKAIASSGYPNDPVMKNCRLFGFDAAILKPYHMEELKSLLTRLIPAD
ncbi:MAG: response regulator [Desulfococcaceae bacterium]